MTFAELLLSLSVHAKSFLNKKQFCHRQVFFVQDKEQFSLKTAWYLWKVVNHKRTAKMGRKHVQTWILMFGFGPNGPSWTISTMFFFYLLSEVSWLQISGWWRSHPFPEHFLTAAVLLLVRVRAAWELDSICCWWRRTRRRRRRSVRGRKGKGRRWPRKSCLHLFKSTAL